MKQRRERHGVSMTSNGPAPEAAAALYVGDVMHQRMKPFGHRFRYRVFSMAIDLDRLDEANGLSMLFSVNRRNAVSFFERDHGGDNGVRAHADELLAHAGLTARRIVLVCYPRILGYVFNPLSVYYAYGADDDVIAMIYEVRNTFGERHTYVCPVGADEICEAGVRQSCDKVFHVSPFIGMGMRYNFRMLPPGQEIRWRILETDASGPLLAATFAGRQVSVSTANLARLTASIPLLPIKIVGGIHWEALKLWLKGAKYISRPAPPAPVSVVAPRAMAEAAE
jgi:DUF1365 family protein